ncbi:hypothetical protein HZ326_12799 [Fusarium oxysporum f. sp. albedinis]|nr:hypothetical protein HZ326_12799 [Fusarium oxysporum f. sp. albedinis]
MSYGVKTPASTEPLITRNHGGTADHEGFPQHWPHTVGLENDTCSYSWPRGWDFTARKPTAPRCDYYISAQRLVRLRWGLKALM